VTLKFGWLSPAIGNRWSDGVPIAAYQDTAILPTALPHFDSLWLADHFYGMDTPTDPFLEAFTTLTWLAARHDDVQLCHHVLGVGYRHPPLLAKMAATLQDLTGGRYILGLGAGWHEEEYAAYGYDYPSGGTRVAQLEEAIQVVRAIWAGSPATFQGEHYRVEGAVCLPKPDPPPPIMVGTNGPKALRVVARHADWWTWDGPWESTYRRPYELLRAHCEEIGRPFDEITLTCQLAVWFPDDPSAFQSTYEHSFYPGQVFEILGPTPAEAIPEIQRLVDLGVRHFQIGLEDMATVRRFAAEVVPAFG